jgi:alpha-ketoglutarate-dependent taurine dioxygenase
MVMSCTTEHFKATIADKGFARIHGVESEDEYLSIVGTVGALVPQYDGRFVWSIKADPRFDDHYHSLNAKELNPHTECYEFDGLPPHYLALWCVVPNECGGGQTTLADGYAFFESLNESDRALLTDRRFRFSSSSGIQASQLGRTAEHKVFDVDTLPHPIFRFSYNCMDRDGSEQMDALAERCMEFFNDTRLFFNWSRGDLLIWDNHRVLHSRTAFKDRKRELRRVWLS